MLKVGDYVFLERLEQCGGHGKLPFKITEVDAYLVKIGTIAWYSPHEFRRAKDEEILAAKLLGI